MHPLLARQLSLGGVSTDTPPSDAEQWRELLARIESAYKQADDDRSVLARSLSISSDEVSELSESLRMSEARLAIERDVEAAVPMDEPRGRGLFLIHRLAGRFERHLSDSGGLRIRARKEIAP